MLKEKVSKCWGRVVKKEEVGVGVAVEVGVEGGVGIGDRGLEMWGSEYKCWWFCCFILIAGN